MRFLILIACFGLSAIASENENWVKNDLSPGSKMKQLFYSQSLADAFFTSPTLDAPPIQHFSENVHGDFSVQSRVITRRILNHLGVDLKAKTTKEHGTGKEKFFTGAKEDLAARAYDYKSVNDYGSDIVTCVVVVKDKQKVHAIYLESWEPDLPDCVAKLKKLAKDPILYK